MSAFVMIFLNLLSPRSTYSSVSFHLQCKRSLISYRGNSWSWESGCVMVATIGLNRIPSFQKLLISFVCATVLTSEYPRACTIDTYYKRERDYYVPPDFYLFQFQPTCKIRLTLWLFAGEWLPGIC